MLQVISADTGTSLIKKFLISVLIVMLLLSAGGAFIYFRFTGLMGPVAGSGPPVKVEVAVPQGTNSAQIARMLWAKGLIQSETVFRLYAMYRNLDGRLQAGEYELSTGLSTPEIIERLARGETSSYTFTIPEGYTLKQIADKLSANNFVNRDRFLDLAAYGSFRHSFLRGVPPGPNRLEGYLFPDTYKITKKTTEKEIINIMLDRFERELSKYKIAELAAEKGLTVHQAVTLASIVEREAQKDEERPKVAAVFLNRLKKGWKLESCATIQYILGQPKARLFEKDLQIESPYNTYMYPGLPPGPIASPGGPSLKAAVNPADVDYLFFVVADDGKHIFGRTLQEHNRNKAEYLKRLKAEKQ